MSTPRAVALRLDITKEREGGYLITASVPGSAKPWTNRTPAFSLDESRLGYADAMAEFKRLIGPQLEPADWDKIARALHDLRLVSGRLMTALAGPDHIPSFRKFVEKALEPLRDPPYAPLVEVSAPSNLLFPFELVQVRPGNWPPVINDKASLTRACTAFLGFSAAIRRIFTDLAGDGDGLDQNRILRNRKGLALTLFQEASSLKGARAEAAFFRGNEKFFQLRVWPQPRSTAIAAGLAKQLFDSRFGLDGKPGRSFPDEIQHFACHCRMSDDNPILHALRLGAEKTASCAITLGQLDAEFGLVEADEDPLRPGPLVFLNACASAAIPEGFSTSFTQWFLRNRNRGLIGTESAIPDTFASTFAAQFYRALLTKEPIGQALLSTKRHMVHKYGNPLGMVYTMYADPDLEVEIKVDKELLHE